VGDGWEWVREEGSCGEEGENDDDEALSFPSLALPLLPLWLLLLRPPAVPLK